MAKCKIDEKGNMVCDQTTPIIMMSGTRCRYCDEAKRELAPMIKKGQIIVVNEKSPEYPALSKKHNLRQEGVPTFEINGKTCDYNGINGKFAEFIFKNGKIVQFELVQ